MADTDKKTVAELREVIDATDDRAVLDELEAAEGPDGRKTLLEAIERRRAQLDEDADAEADGESDGAERTQNERTRGDETVPGGRYLVNGRLVNANGQPISE